MNAHLRWFGFIVLSAAGVLSSADAAQTYPTRPIRILVGFQAGGGVDISARAVGKQLTEALGQSVVVDNRPGASGNIAADIVAKAQPDGYTLLMANLTISMPSLFAKLPFDINKDLVPVSLIALGPSVLVVHPSLPVNSVKELIAAAKAKPKQLIYGSGGTGNITHLEMVLFTNLAGIDMIHVPYKGGAPSVIGLLSGEVQMLFTSIPSVLPQITARKLKPLAVSTAKRSSALPEIPTIHEAGLSGYDAASWYGLFAPAGVSKIALGVLSKEIVKIMRIREVRDKFAGDGFDPVGNSPEEFARFVREEIPKWAKIVKTAGIKGE
ncbi:MAG: tripartite tricarboxylate transporter substrate binding protein [Betaproteobacteria bacterium]|nr:tripartite tricarboxylate transporter substrate binding protein [Betaproteobacteria bacterium]